jgi:hypothetical protein
MGTKEQAAWELLRLALVVEVLAVVLVAGASWVAGIFSAATVGYALTIAGALALLLMLVALLRVTTTSPARQRTCLGKGYVNRGQSCVLAMLLGLVSVFSFACGLLLLLWPAF